MKIAYVTTYDPNDIHAWSGIGYHIHKALQQSGFSIDYIGNLKDKNKIFMKIKTRFYKKILKKNYLSDREHFILNYYAKQIEGILPSINPDIIFSPGTLPIAYLKTDRPIVFWTDATFAGMIDFYPEFSNLCKRSIREGNRMEQEALSKSRLAIYASEWAAKTAIDNYDVDPKKVKVVPFGANVICSRSSEDIKMILKNKNSEKCQLLFLGVAWERKGGPIALKTAEILNSEGIKTQLQVVGCNPPGEMPDFVTRHGFVSKTSPKGRKLLDHLFSEAHFLILPSRAECAGIVFAEASSFGLPSLATNVGGISTMVRDNVNGKLFSLNETAEAYSQYIINIMSSKEKFQQLAESSFEEYQNKLNWTSAGQHVHKLIQDFCS